MPISPPSHRLLADEASEQEIDPDRGHGQEVAAHAKRRETHEHAERSAGKNPRKKCERKIAGADHHQSRRIGTGAVERRMAEADLPAKAADHVKAHGKDHVDSNYRQ